ncbi:hypothetical protein SAMN02799622_00822 [Methylobacterium sp. UNC378MF]|uniref:hypothetical protein n=1 Tax=Methylobacterium sp. UNC378MF TaxID=1502748 RepID=UPI00088ABDD0|nr:hypothetical protein [Methylobacterium sp. UNC378MF]SDA12825.1 hypothetical protein SAMN02799622_00822 [Methylobacterium sp. UNC378MF]
MLGFLFQAWAAFSPLASIVGACGIACVVVAFVGAMFVPERLKMPLIGVGALLITGAAIWQAAEAKGAHDAFKVVAAANLKAERERAEKAEAITKDLAEQATRDLAAAQADNAQLKDLNDALAHDPRGTHPAVPRDLARRLRAL